MCILQKPKFVWIQFSCKALFDDVSFMLCGLQLGQIKIIFCQTIALKMLNRIWIQREWITLKLNFSNKLLSTVRYFCFSTNANPMQKIIKLNVNSFFFFFLFSTFFFVHYRCGKTQSETNGNCMLCLFLSVRIQ